jgi:hypothetical protein
MKVQKTVRNKILVAVLEGINQLYIWFNYVLFQICSLIPPYSAVFTSSIRFQHSTIAVACLEPSEHIVLKSHIKARAERAYSNLEYKHFLNALFVVCAPR